MAPAGSKLAPEAKAREKIDHLLEQSGWVVQARDQTGDCLLYKRLDRGTFRGTLDLDAKGAQIEINAPELERAFRGARQEKLRLH